MKSACSSLLSISFCSTNSTMIFNEFLASFIGYCSSKFNYYCRTNPRTMTPFQILASLFLVIVACQQCFANQEVNNEQCTSPSNPLFNQTIPWRITLENVANLYMPYNQSFMVLTDTTGCFSFQLFFFSYQGIRGKCWTSLKSLF